MKYKPIICYYCNKALEIESTLQNCSNCDGVAYSLFRPLFNSKDEPIDPELNSININIKNDIQLIIFLDMQLIALYHVKESNRSGAKWIKDLPFDKLIHLPLNKLKCKISNLLPFL